MFFFFNDTATTEIYTLSLHDALPIWLPPPTATSGRPARPGTDRGPPGPAGRAQPAARPAERAVAAPVRGAAARRADADRRRGSPSRTGHRRPGPPGSPRPTPRRGPVARSCRSRELRAAPARHWNRPAHRRSRARDERSEERRV